MQGMTSSRRGFFATLAALPAAVMGRKAIAAPVVGDWYPRYAHQEPAREITIRVHGPIGDANAIERSIIEAIVRSRTS